MKKLIKRIYKRLLIKIYLWLRNNSTFNPKREMTKNEAICISICRKLINHPDSKFLIAPLSHKRYLKNQTLGLFIVLESTQISITNHVYHYDVTLTLREWEKIAKQYDSKTEKIRQDYENEIKSQIVHSLSTILEKVS